MVDPLRSGLLDLRRRYQKAQLVRLGGASLAIALALEGILLFLRPWLPHPEIWLVLAAFLILAVAVYRWLEARPSFFALARDLDARYGLEERLATAVELLEQDRRGTLVERQLEDARRVLARIPVEQAYRPRWGRWSWPILPALAILLCGWLLVPKVSTSQSLTSEQRGGMQALLNPLLEAAEREGFRSRRFEAALRASSVAEAQRELGKLRGEAREALESQKAELLQQIESAPLSSSAKRQLRDLLEQSDQISPESLESRLRSLAGQIPPEWLDKLGAQLRRLNRNQQALQALVAGIQRAQHQLAQGKTFAWNQEGGASQEAGKLPEGTEEIPGTVSPPQEMRLTPQEVPNAPGTLTAGTGEGAEKPVGVDSQTPSLVEQTEVGLAVLAERLPTRYREPIARYLQRIAQIEEER